MPDDPHPRRPHDHATAPPGDDNVTTTRSCPACGAAFVRVRRQRYCSPACRQTAYRARHHQPPPELDTITRPPRRRDSTIYACPDCEQRYHGQQWCHDCNRPCRRLGPGGPCPSCDHPLTGEDLLPPTPRPSDQLTRPPNRRHAGNDTAHGTTKVNDLTSGAFPISLTPI
jgi:hypothetical protein